MKHMGDITKISGYRVEPVNVIIGGSRARTSLLLESGRVCGTVSWAMKVPPALGCLWSNSE